MTLYFDIECDGLLDEVTKVHCISILYDNDPATYLYGPRDIKSAIKKISEYNGYIVGHNICAYDVPVLSKLHGLKLHPKAKLIDTLLLGCILYPEDGILSLETWAKKLGLEEQKVQHEDWSTYSAAMGERCRSDTIITRSVYQHLEKNAHYGMVADGPLDLEVQVGLIHARSYQVGAYFDVEKGIALHQELANRRDQLQEELRESGPWRMEIPGVAKSRQEEYRENEGHEGVDPFRKDGSYSVRARNYFKEDIDTVQGHYCPVSFVPFNPDSPDEVRSFLLSVGWQPTEWNYVRDKMSGEVRITSPKLTEDSYASLPPGLGQKIAEYNVLCHRAGTLLNREGTSGALLKIRADGTIGSEAFTCATPTARYRHQGVICNMPRIRTLYGKELRSLYGVPPGCTQIGADLSGIEIRMLAHFLLAGSYEKARETADLILSPDKGNDFHSFNQGLWRLASRDIAKNTLYAIVYGAGAKKIAQTAGVPESRGAKIKKDFLSAHPGIAELIKDLEFAYQRNGGFIRGLDGRPLYVRQKIRLLNVLLQNAAAIVFKTWMALTMERPWAREGTIKLFIEYHDEMQWRLSSTDKDYIDMAKRCLKDDARRAGRALDLKVPIEAECKHGKNWAQTH
jgi:hypothetical protein